jgi:cyclophilin family peptidyl-prolyl cis-trans isomerase/HEAT repeat protein
MVRVVVRRAPLRAAVFAVLAAASAASAAAQSTAPLRERMLLAEDARAQTDAELSALRQGLTSRDLATRLQAVRAIGRLERPDLIPALTRPLADESVDVRMEAANAVGQLARGPKGVADAKTRLLARAKVEGDPRAWGAVAATLGRLPYTTPEDVDQAEAVIARVLPTSAATAIQIDALLGATQGLEAMARQSGKISKLKPQTLAGLRAASKLEGRAQDADKLARIRRFATMALTASGAVLRPELEAWAADADAEVRRLGMIAARADVEDREPIVRKGLADQQAQVRYEALQTWGRQLQKTSCDPVLAATRDADAHVQLLAIDLLGNGCPDAAAAASALQAIAETVSPDGGAWHAPAHAIVSLARTVPAEARKLLPRYAGHRVWQVRMYAARAAGALAALDELDALGRDVNDNVREAALGELVTLRRPEAIPLALDALKRFDYQLVLTAARALGVPEARDRAVPALLEALARITAEKRDTSRDPRMAILNRLKDLGWPDGAAAGDAAAALRPYLTDFDPAIAARAAEILNDWQKGPATAVPQRLPRPAVSLAAIDALRATRLRFVMAGRGAFDLQLLLDQAPLTALRIATRAREGYYNGLTFHRVVPNFVIQGGSPGANEYMGDGLYMRDEVGLPSHRRGTVGISTRGRDTGDAQIFVNLVDLPRLDHTYTVFAEVVAGIDVVDHILEGDVIERVELVPSGSR